MLYQRPVYPAELEEDNMIAIRQYAQCITGFESREYVLVLFSTVLTTKLFKNRSITVAGMKYTVTLTGYVHFILFAAAMALGLAGKSTPEPPPRPVMIWPN